MAEIVQSLFGVTPQMYQQQQADAADARAMQYARLSPFEQANFAIGRGASQLVGALGGQDPMLQMISARNQIAQQIDYNDPASIGAAVRRLSAIGDSQGAMMLADASRKAQSEQALIGQRTAAEKSSLATAAKTELSVAQENSLRAQLALLSPNATDADIRSVLVQFGDPDKVLTMMQTAATKEADRGARADTAAAAAQARTDAAALAAQARIDAAKVAADAALERAREAGATRQQIAQMQIESRQDLARLTASLKGPKVLPTGLQKDEGKDLEQIDSLTARIDSLAPAIASLTPDPTTKKTPLELGPIANLRYQGQNATGNSTPESRAYAALQRSVQEATNLKTDAAKGVQTDKDVLRFANELIAAFGKNDTKTTLDALTNFSKSTQTAIDKNKVRVDSRRKSQGIEAYYGEEAKGTAKNPIKLD